MRKGFEKRFKHGDIVYWCDRENNQYRVQYGRVDEQFSDAVCIDLLELKETRYVDGIPLDKFETEYKYRKLPKGWSYNTELFKLEYKENPEDRRRLEELQVRLDDPVSVAKAYEAGLLIKADKKFHGRIEADITREGFRLVKKYTAHHRTRVSVKPDKVYFTYEEAQAEADGYLAECKRQAALSDQDWAIEQIDKTINKWKSMYGVSDQEALDVRSWLLSVKNVKDIETRIYGSDIQWKYGKNKKWNSIVL